jgi:hypothetical protein
VAVVGDYAYVADYWSGLHIIDVSDPRNPQEVGSYDTPGSTRNLAVAGSYAYMADGSTGLRVIDVSDPQDPQEVGYYDTPGYAFGVAFAGGYAYVADYWSGLQTIEFHGPGVEETRMCEVRTTNALPTIIRGILLLPSPLLTPPSSLLSANGRKVLDLKPGANDVSRLAPGVYFVREAQAQAQATRKVAVLH